MSRWFLASVFGFAGGILLQTRLAFGWPVSFLCWLLAVAFCFLSWFQVRSRTPFLFLAVLSAAAGFGVARLELAVNTEIQALVPLIGRQVTLQGVVTAEPDERGNSTKLVVELGEKKTRILVAVPNYYDFRYGDRLKFTGRLVRPRSFLTETRKEFDYAGYLAKDAIYFQMFYPQVERLTAGEGFWLKSALFDLKRVWLDKVNRLVPEPSSALLAGLLVGERRGLGEELQRAFRRTGVIHVVVLSGYNVMIIAENLMKGFFYILPRYLGFGLGAVSILSFAVMTGASATVVRASLMALIGLVARATGRVSDATAALTLTGFLMLLYNPKILTADPGFQLSFIATLGLIHLTPRFEQTLLFMPRFGNLRAIAAATLATQLSVLPWLLYKMGEFSVVAAPVNLLILPFIPATMFFGFFAGLVGFFSSFWAQPLALAGYLLLAYELAVVRFFSGLPFASAGVTSFSVWWVWLGYGILIHIFYPRFFTSALRSIQSP